MRNDVRDLRYRIGDVLGDYAPDSFRRHNSRSEWMIGLGSVLVAGGISYLAMRMADRRLADVIRRIVPTYATRHEEDWPTARDAGSSDMSDIDMERRRSMGRMERQAAQRSDGMQQSERQVSRN
jgi:hypothetical protein